MVEELRAAARSLACWRGVGRPAAAAAASGEGGRATRRFLHGQVSYVLKPLHHKYIRNYVLWRGIRPLFVTLWNVVDIQTNSERAYGLARHRTKPPRAGFYVQLLIIGLNAHHLLLYRERPSRYYLRHWRIRTNPEGRRGGRRVGEVLFLEDFVDELLEPGGGVVVGHGGVVEAVIELRSPKEEES
jgi:hypothetical protein